MSMSRIYRAPCGLTHRVVKERYPATLDAEFGTAPEGQGFETLDLPEKFAGCKTCPKLESKPCFGIGGPELIKGVTQFICPGWKLTND